jgi:hypothetical protein
MHKSALVPSFAEPRVSARLSLALAAALGCGVCAYAGLYPRFDDGALRGLLAATSAPFAAAVVASALSAPSAARAFGRALVFAGLLGAASIILPAAVLSRHDGGQFFAACTFGAILGAITGMLYGFPLAILASVGHAHVRARTHDATDRAARVSGIWLALVGLVGIAGTRVLDAPKLDWETQAMTYPSAFPTVLACSAIAVSLVAIVTASMRLRRRGAWLDRVRAGLEPAFRMRVVDPRDPVAALPRLGEGETVVELVLDETSGGAYRVAASGTAVALVSDPR